MLNGNSVESKARPAQTGIQTDGPIFEKQRGKNFGAFECNEWLDSNEAAAFLRISPGTLRNLTSNGKVPFYKFGRRNRYRMSELVALLSSHSRGVRNGN